MQRGVRLEKEEALPCFLFLFLNVPRKALAAGAQVSVDVFSFLEGVPPPIPPTARLDGGTAGRSVHRSVPDLCQCVEHSR